MAEPRSAVGEVAHAVEGHALSEHSSLGREHVLRATPKVKAAFVVGLVEVEVLTVSRVSLVVELDVVHRRVGIFLVSEYAGVFHEIVVVGNGHVFVRPLSWRPVHRMGVFSTFELFDVFSQLLVLGP